VTYVGLAIARPLRLDVLGLEGAAAGEPGTEGLEVAELRRDLIEISRLVHGTAS
jgi:hypothetical protein